MFCCAGRIETINAELTRQSRSPGKKALNGYATDKEMTSCDASCCFCFELCCAVLRCVVQSRVALIVLCGVALYCIVFIICFVVCVVLYFVVLCCVVLRCVAM